MTAEKICPQCGTEYDAERLICPRDGTPLRARVTRVFISHSAHDRERIEREIIAPLREHGLETWYSRADIQGAEAWERRIREALNQCDWFLVAMSPSAVASEWVQTEVHWALEQRPGRVVPVLLEPCDPTQAHLKLVRIQHIDFTRNPSDALNRLLAVWGIKRQSTGAGDARSPAARSSFPERVASSGRSFARLRQRMLIHWALAYLAGAWVCLQGLALLIDTYGWSESVMPLMVLGLGVGFLAVLAVAWFQVEKRHLPEAAHQLGLLIIGLLVGGAILALARGRSGDAQNSRKSIDERAAVRRLELLLPDSAPLAFVGAASLGVGRSALAISPDGSRLVYVAHRGSTTQLYLRQLDRIEAAPLRGTEGAYQPFFSRMANGLASSLRQNSRRCPSTEAHRSHSRPSLTQPAAHGRRTTGF